MPMNKIRGFTLLELIITVAVAAILFTIAVPSFQNMVQSNRTTTQVNNFVTATTMARSEAIRQSRNVTVCASSDEASCTGDSDWSVGWIVIEGPNSDGDYGSVLRVWGPPSGSPTMDAADHRIIFEGNGRVESNITTRFSNDRDHFLEHRMPNCIDRTRDVRVTSTGRTVVRDPDCSDI